MVAEESRKEERPEYKVGVQARRLQVTAYTETLKIIGRAYVGVPPRSTARRPSDILFYYPEEFLKLGQARVIDRSTEKIIDEPPFIIVNLKRVHAIHAEEVGEEGK